MDTITRLALKPLDRHDPDSIRIYEQTREAVERLNVYLFDFVDSVVILKENLAKNIDLDESAKAGETGEKIAYMEGKIISLCEEMRRIAGEMPEFIEAQEVQREAN